MKLLSIRTALLFSSWLTLAPTVATASPAAPANSPLGLPLWGDRAYGDAAADRAQGASRLWLHAADLALRHPASGAPIAVTAPVPADMAGFALGPDE